MAGIVFTFAGDEAGDVSMNFKKGGSRYFAFSLVGTRHPDQLRDVLQGVRQELKLLDTFEFSFHSLTSEAIRNAVFGELGSAEMEVWAVVVDKATLSEPFRVMRRADFWTYFVCEAIQLVPSDKRQNGYLILDEYSLPDDVDRQVRRGLRARDIPRQFRKIVGRRSSSEPLIQIADLVSGAILRKYSKADDEAMKMISSKIQVIEVFGQ